MSTKWLGEGRGGEGSEGRENYGRQKVGIVAANKKGSRCRPESRARAVQLHKTLFAAEMRWLSFSNTKRVEY